MKKMSLTIIFILAFLNISAAQGDYFEQISV